MCCRIVPALCPGNAWEIENEEQKVPLGHGKAVSTEQGLKRFLKLEAALRGLNLVA